MVSSAEHTPREMVMTRSLILIAAVAAVLFNAGCGAQAPPAGQDAEPRARAEHHASAIPAYQPTPGRERPIVAVVAHHKGAEVTDFVVPYGILATSGLAEVVAVSTAEGPIEMFPALTIEPDATTEQFDRDNPAGADYVIVPAVHHPADPGLTGWIRAQAEAGATIVGVCDGVLVLASAGLLEGRRATGHWFSLGRLERNHPETEWVRDRRYVADGNVITTTGVAASVPVSLALVEAIGGTQQATEVARRWRIDDWGPAHDSDDYGLAAGHVFTWLGNTVAFWRNDTFEVPVEEGVDEVTLSLFADAWSRTYRSKMRTVASADGPVRMRGGLRILPDRVHDGMLQTEQVPDGLVALDPLSTLDGTLSAIADAYGRRTAAFVALQLEYPWSAADRGTDR